MKETRDGVAVLGFVAASGTGKTTLMRKVIAELSAGGLRVGCIKHTHHPFDIDQPGKDSHALRSAGASQMLLGSPRRWALIVEEPSADGDDLEALLGRLELPRLDLVLVEGFKLGPYPKIEVQRAELAAAPLYPTLPSVIALVTNQRPPPLVPMAVFDLDAAHTLAEFIRSHVARARLARRVDAGIESRDDLA